MTCVSCGRYAADPGNSLCQSCLLEEFASLVERRRDLRRAEFADMPPDLCFLLNVMVDAGWSERAVTAAQHALSQPEEAIPAVFAHLAEPA